MLERNSIYNRDCIAGMRQLAEGTVDLTFADPPFNIGYDYDIYDDRQERDQYLDWSRQWIAGVHRVLKPTGTFWLAIGDEYAAELKIISQAAGFTCRSWVIWYYTFGVNCTRKFNRSHAHLFQFVKNPEEFTFNFKDPAIRVPSARQLVYADGRANPNGRLPDDTWILRPQDVSDGFRADDDTWYFPRVAGTFKERAGFHGCQMPEQLLGRIIRASSNESDPPELVLDPFSGSATTLVVAKKLRRDYLGFDLSPEYVKQGQARLASVTPGDALVGADEPLLSAPATPQTPNQRAKRGTRPMAFAAPVPPVAPEDSFDGDRSVPTTWAPKVVRQLEHAVMEAYRVASQGFSADRVLVDDPLRTAFSELCARKGAPGDSVFWNQTLLRLRKAGRLADTPALRRTDVDWALATRYVFASEIAMRKMADQGHTLDMVLCDTRLLRSFDEISQSFAPGFSAFEYRWAALKFRKEALRQFRKSSDSIADRLSRRQSVFDIALGKLRNVPGLYLITGETADTRIYAGMTFDLANRIESLMNGPRLHSAWSNYAKDAFIQVRELKQPSRDFWNDGFGRQERLATRLEPCLNFIRRSNVPA